LAGGCAVAAGLEPLTREALLKHNRGVVGSRSKAG
jgi:hypothetical protein